MQNLNFWRFFHPVLCVDEDGIPCSRLRPFLIGDTVFFDLDANGTQDGGEPGISGVLVELLDDEEPGTRMSALKRLTGELDTAAPLDRRMRQILYRLTDDEN
ncbi:MAG: hypothetical protein KDD47_15435, partial [Acidobacteria bacterium]|nr:hypothetical protein [Acidobacteriota bacterium]